jgi:hypothetical protein
MEFNDCVMKSAHDSCLPYTCRYNAACAGNLLLFDGEREENNSSQQSDTANLLNSLLMLCMMPAKIASWKNERLEIICWLIGFIFLTKVLQQKKLIPMKKSKFLYRSLNYL